MNFEFRILRIKTTKRRTSSVQVNATGRNSVFHETYLGTFELDLHADTTVFWRNFIILNSTGHECNVIPYTDTYESVKVF